MSKLYNRFAGQDMTRLAALSDGIFAVGMTLLVLDLRVPSGQGNGSNAPIGSEQALLRAVWGLAPHVGIYLMSFLTLGIFWVGQQTQLERVARSNRDLAWLHLGFLLAVTLIPFSTALLAAYSAFRIALLIYWFNIFLLGLMLFVAWRYAVRSKLVVEDVTAEVCQVIERRIIVAQALYAGGALLCFFNTSVSIAVIVLIQLNYAIAPRIRWLYRI